MAKIEAVLFDYGMVLSGPPEAEARARMETLLAADSSGFHEAYWRFRDAYDRGALTGVGYWHEVAKSLGRTLDDATTAALVEADVAHWTQPNPEMIAWAAALQSAGIKTGILSNLGDAMEEGILAKFDWLGRFTHCTFSHRLGIAKPDPLIYRHAAEGLNVSPASILFIDDREENIAAARRAGMAAILYSNHDAFVQAMQRAGYSDLLSPGA